MEKRIIFNILNGRHKLNLFNIILITSINMLPIYLIHIYLVNAMLMILILSRDKISLFILPFKPGPIKFSLIYKNKDIKSLSKVKTLELLINQKFLQRISMDLKRIHSMLNKPDNENLPLIYLNNML
jgi:hypothetical protein